MDYRFLVKRLRAKNIKTDFGRVKLDICDKAADAIEALLVERDAAVRDINELLKATEDQQCAFCVWQGDCPQEFYSCARNARWRGPQKGEYGNGMGV